ncbi:MAG: sugar phosphate isomerase/epimerase family protein [Pseudomonadota bacterium]
MKLGVITDGIGRDFDHALQVMDEFDLEYAELQFIDGKEVGDFDKPMRARIKQSLARHNKKVSCLSRHVFAGLTHANKIGDADHVKHMDGLRRVIETAHELDARWVRILTPKKEMILWGKNGAEVWNVATGAWDDMLPLIAPAIELARKENIQLVVETGNGTMVNSCFTARKMIDDLDAKGTLFVLWDPANNCWAHEKAYPDGYEEIQGGYLGHIHIKDVHVNTPHAILEVRPMGEGDLADQFAPMAKRLRDDQYDGIISFESVYHPGNGNFEDGFRLCIEKFKQLYG